MDLSGYRIIEQIHQSSNSEIFKAIREKDNLPVILKAKLNRSSDKAYSELSHEYEIAKDLNSEHVVQHLTVEKDRETAVLVLQDDSMDPLSQQIPQEDFNLRLFIQLAIEIAAAIEYVHAQGIFHKDINPYNIIVNSSLDKVKLIDFELSTRMTRVDVPLQSPSVLVGTLAYLSPEQTGRINRSVDCRSDLYSLGVTLYEFSTGQLPFVTDDILELVHCHIAKCAVPPDQINPDIPKVISDIIMKLLVKNAEERYQSATGVLADLRHCLKSVNETYSIDFFKAGEMDYANTLKIPQKLYGREQEIESLLESFNRISRGKGEMILIAGYSGVGKTALVREVHKPMTDKNGYFASGKFDQLQKDIPYSAITSAFNELCRYMLTEDNHIVEAWRKNITAALGNNGQVVIDIIPDLQLIIGKQPNVIALGAIETQNRFLVYLKEFIKIISSEQHPLIIFIDDLQWADSASLSLLESIMTDDEITHLLIIGAYRDNEVDKGHRLI